MPRFLIEGEWLGYRSSQDRIVHREVTTDAKLAEAVAKIYAITYTDGTALRLSVKKLPPRANVRDPLTNGYGRLIRDCVRHGVDTVDELVAIRRGEHGGLK